MTNAQEQTDESPLHKHMILGVVGATTLDRIITLQHFGMEANPVVNALGQMLWTILSACLIVAMCAVWYTMGLHEYLLPKVLVFLLTAFTFVVFASNLYVVLTA